MALARIQRWALTLSAYDFVISYKPGEQHANADVLSRLPLPDAPTSVPTPGDTVFLMDALENSPVTVVNIKMWTNRDPLLSKVCDVVLQGWPNQCPSEEVLKPFTHRKNELSVEDGCILWGNRVVVPAAGRARVMEELDTPGYPE